jgi:hypothetical protein
LTPWSLCGGSTGSTRLLGLLLLLLLLGLLLYALLWRHPPSYW